MLCVGWFEQLNKTFRNPDPKCIVDTFKNINILKYKYFTGLRKAQLKEYLRKVHFYPVKFRVFFINLFNSIYIL